MSDKKKVKPIPEGYHTATPYLIVDGAAKALDFYKQAFGAEELFRMERDGKVGHAEIQIGDSRIMLADEHVPMGARSPRTIGGTPVSLMLYVDDSDAWMARAEQAGARITQPLEDKFYGDRTGTVEDPFGHQWHLATHKEDVSPEEMERRMAALA
jgi:PhnB protein